MSSPLVTVSLPLFLHDTRRRYLTSKFNISSSKFGLVG